MSKPKIIIKRSTDLHSQCNFCLSKKNVNQVFSDRLAFVVSICDECIEKVYTENKKQKEKENVDKFFSQIDEEKKPKGFVNAAERPTCETCRFLVWRGKGSRSQQQTYCKKVVPNLEVLLDDVCEEYEKEIVIKNIQKE